MRTENTRVNIRWTEDQRALTSVLMQTEASGLTSSPNVGEGPQLIVLSSAAIMMLLFLWNKNHKVRLTGPRPSSCFSSNTAEIPPSSRKDQHPLPPHCRAHLESICDSLWTCVKVCTSNLSDSPTVSGWSTGWWSGISRVRNLVKCHKVRKVMSDVHTHPHARLRTFQPHRSCTALGYMVDSLETLVTPQKNSPPVNTARIRRLSSAAHSHLLHKLLRLLVESEYSDS